MQPALSALACLAFAALAPAQVASVATETFDYPTGNLGSAAGGFGFAGAWDTGVAGSNGVVLVPGFDPTGGKVQIDPVTDGATCFRTVDVVPWPSLTEAGFFGVDGSTIWISFRTRRGPGVAASWGGFSLFEGASERIFIGSPGNSQAWGVHDHVFGGVHAIPNTNVEIEAQLVTRIDYGPGFERLRLWIDPPVPHPTSAPVLDVLAGDHRWERIRVASGGGLPNGYEFDDVRIEGVTGGPVGTSYCGPAFPNSTGVPATISGFGSATAAANDLTLTASMLPPGQFGYFLASRTQGFFNPPGSQGLICVSGNIGRYNQSANIIQGPSGSLSLNLTAIPVNPPVAAAAGDTWNFQCWFRDVNPALTSNFTDGLTLTFF